MITENYIKMCEQAKEIQDKWRNPFRNKFGDTYWRGKKYLQISEACVLNIVSHLKVENEIWLPTQEQLWEMVSCNWHDVFCKFLWWHWNDDKNSEEFKSMFTSMNEVWIAFVMKEKYNKIWTGSKWVANE